VSMAFKMELYLISNVTLSHIRHIIESFAKVIKRAVAEAIGEHAPACAPYAGKNIFGRGIPMWSCPWRKYEACSQLNRLSACDAQAGNHLEMKVL